MPYKVCPDCGAISYSSVGDGKWECPKCGCDLTDLEATISSPKCT